ncbi:MAG TPA: hypothetical protein VN109_06880, partial [Devosia sp.]|nr:hypothetical protein [Devosia sp.]
VGGATRLVKTMGTPLTPALATVEGGEPKRLDTKDFYIQGSILRVRVDNRQPLAYGMSQQVDVFFDSDQSFVPAAGSSGAGFERVAWYDSPHPLRSGWAIGEERLANTIAVADVDVGKGKLLVLGPEVTQRAQSYGTFKLLFNGLLYGSVSSNVGR